MYALVQKLCGGGDPFYIVYIKTLSDKVRSGIGEHAPEPTAEGDPTPVVREARDHCGPAEPDNSTQRAGDLPPEAAPARPLREYSPEMTQDARGDPDKNLCRQCRTLIKLADG